MFDFEEYAREEGLPIRRGPGDERITTCIICGKEKHLYYNIRKNQWICHRCGEAGNNMRFIMVHQGVGYTKAISFLEERTSLNIGRIRKRLKLFQQSLWDGLNIADFKVIIPLPKSAIPVTDSKYPKFFGRRGYNRKMIFFFNPHISEKNPYEGRILFPFTCDGHESFVAYSPHKDIEPKTLNPVGSNNSDLLYGYDLYRNTRGPIVLVEGITDVIRLAHWGHAAFALLGKNLSDHHLYLLDKCNAGEIVVCLDGDIPIQTYKNEEGREVKGLLERAMRLDKNISKKVAVAWIPNKERDPDSLFESEFFTIYSSRCSVSALKRKAILKSFTN